MKVQQTAGSEGMDSSIGIKTYRCNSLKAANILYLYLMSSVQLYNS